MLRIEKVSEDDAVVTLKVEGRILGDWVAVLEEEGSQILRGQTGGVLDLAGVGFIDRGGLALLKKLRGDRVRFANRSSYVQHLLEWAQKP